MRLTYMLTTLAVIVPFVSSQYPFTYGCIAQILAYAPMNKLYNFMVNTNADKTLALKKKRAADWVPKNLGTHQFAMLDMYSNKDKALAAVNGLLDHRNTVGLFWDELQPGITKVFNASVSKQYKNMWAKTDKVYDNSFFDALNQWYAYCHYRSPAGKRTALYNAIQKVTGKYVNNTQLNYTPLPALWTTQYFLYALFGLW